LLVKISIDKSWPITNHHLPCKQSNSNEDEFIGNDKRSLLNHKGGIYETTSLLTLK
jgi:hypothetical protein